MKSQNEKKQMVTSIRLTEEQHQRLKKQAGDRGMTLSNYITTTAVHGETSLTPEPMIHLQNIVNEVSDIVQEYAPERKEKIQREVNRLWSSLK